MSEELETFLGGLNLSEFVQECVVQRVTTVKTLALLSEKNMIELGMKIGDRIAIKEALENRLDSDDLVSIEKAVAVWKLIQDCSDLSLEALSDPTCCTLMPWPTLLVAQLDRMKLIEGKMDVIGREFFGELYRHVVTDRKAPQINVMGTKGVGKSYRLAALVALLLKLGRRVVYLPHCGETCDSLESNLRIALLVAFGDDTSSTSRQQIARCRTKDQLATFCLSQPDKSLIFVLDQFNAVQEDSTYSYRGSKQEIVRDFLIKITRKHVAVLGYSANNYTALWLASKQRNEFDFFVFGGLTQAEYVEWCRTNERIFEGVVASDLDRCRAELRFASGGNPLLLYSFCLQFQNSSVNRSFQSCFDTWFKKELGTVFGELCDFTAAHNESTKVEAFDLAKKALLSCVSAGELTAGPKHFDHRHMFKVSSSKFDLSVAFIASPFQPAEDGAGVCTSGIANAAASKILRTVFHAENLFVQADYVSNALKAVNPVVLGFQVERIVLATIAQSGLDGVPVGEVMYFSDTTHLLSLFRPAFSHNVLYIPEQWNYPRIDAVFVSKKQRPGQDAAESFLVQFIQITVAAITQEKLDKTRSVMAANSPERALWRRALCEQAKVDFVLRWLVKRDQVNQIPRVRRVVEQVSTIESVHPSLKL